MLLNTQDKLQVDTDAFNFAQKHRGSKLGVELRRGEIVKAAERTSDRLSAPDPDTIGHRSAREVAVIHRFASQVFKHLGMENAEIA
jgi:hypothetical protein